MKRPRYSIALGCLASSLAVSIMAIRVPYYAIFASLALLIVLVVWVVLLRRGAGD
jgi:hypothetical protein